MASLFAMYPAGRAGAGLLLLRLVLALQWLALGGSCPRAVAGSGSSVLLYGLALLLCIGWLTPLLALLYAVLTAYCLLQHWPAPLPLLLFGLASAHGVVLALLGPGAYSLDAQFFGRRRLVLSASGAPDGAAPDHDGRPADEAN